MSMGRKFHSQILSYFIKHNLISVDQFAFLKKVFTTGCLYLIIDDWYEAVNEGEFAMFCFLLLFDIKSAMTPSTMQHFCKS